MKSIKQILLAIACSLIVGTANAELNAQWVDKNQLLKSSLLTKKIESPQVNLSKDPVSFSYKLDATEQLDFTPKPFVESSKQYWLDSNGEKLVNGLNLPVTGGEAIIRISPLSNDKSVQLSANQIEILNNGELSKINVFADSEQLKATGAPFSDNSIALKLNTKAGLLNLKVLNSNPDTAFVIHVFEPNSSYELSLSTSKSTYVSNQAIQINTNLMFDKSSINSELQGYVNRPDGSVLGELKFTQLANGGYNAELNIDQAQGLAQGLWEAHVFAKSYDNGIEIMRDAQTSFAVNLNTANFDGQLKMLSNKIDIGIEVGLKGRYEVRGVLFGSDPSGTLKPLAMTMTAKWLESGKQSIELDIDQKIVYDSGLTAPFVLRNLQLTNQTYLAPVQQITSGLRILDAQKDRESNIR
jgi:hypothetical protein